ncbi:MAG: hypothetical protein M0Z53_03550 [Thermaerobacter sp.]|nr:hypothetical protein [Thermaerobacter sp.]
MATRRAITGPVLGLLMALAPAAGRMVTVPHTPVAGSRLSILIATPDPVQMVSVDLRGSRSVFVRLPARRIGHDAYQAVWTVPAPGRLSIAAYQANGQEVASLTETAVPPPAVPVPEVAAGAVALLGGVFLWKRSRRI